MEEQKQVEAETILNEANQAVKDRWLAIFVQLARSTRFTKFVEANFTISDQINDEEQTIETTVVEKPVAVGPAMTGLQVTGIFRVLKKHGCADQAEAVRAIMEVLGQEDKNGGLVLDGSDTALEEAKKQAELKSKLM